jgi:hypothetical protein
VKRLSAAISGLFARNPNLKVGSDASFKLYQDWISFAGREYPYSPDLALATELRSFAARHRALWEKAPAATRGPGPVEIGTHVLIAADGARAIEVIERAWEAEKNAIANTITGVTRTVFVPVMLAIGVILAWGWAKRG